jgi:hypothetical protein
MTIVTAPPDSTVRRRLMDADLPATDTTPEQLVMFFVSERDSEGPEGAGRS